MLYISTKYIQVSGKNFINNELLILDPVFLARTRALHGYNFY